MAEAEVEEAVTDSRNGGGLEGRKEKKREK